MNNILDITENKDTSEFYPTPPELVQRMLEGIEWTMLRSILEPSAGKGDILRAIPAASREHRYGRALDVDCIEKDEHIRQILKYQFSDERKSSVTQRHREIEQSRTYNRERGDYEPLSPEKQSEYRALEVEMETFFEKGIHIVHDDFLTFDTYKKYDLILMNPPFSEGDKHLLKALEIQKNGGAIVCLLNAETIRNPFTERRKTLINLLNQYDAEIEYIENAFIAAERSARVDVALIRVNIPVKQEESEIFNRMMQAEQVEEYEHETTELAFGDFIKATIQRFNTEVRAGLELIRQYKALAPHIKNGFNEKSRPILRLVNHYERSYEDCVSENDYLKDVREKYWCELLENPKFVGKLTSKLQDEYRNKISTLVNYDFSEFNIYTLLAEINAQIRAGIEDEIVAMFDRLTEKHSYYPEFSKNRHYYNGWKTNQAYKIDKKVIIPCYGVFSEWTGRPDTYQAQRVLEDIERVLNFLDGNMTREVDSWAELKKHLEAGITKNIPTKFFDVTFYKKGTAHITFKCPELIDRFNIYVAKGKKWLPPSYGTKAYKDMDAEERTVVDEFQGEESYNKVLCNSRYYLASPTENHSVLALTG